MFNLFKTIHMKHPKLLFILLTLFYFNLSFAQRGYYDAPYKRYEADSALLLNGAVKTSKSFKQTDVQSEASNQVGVIINNQNASITFKILEAADGLVIRYSIPDSTTSVIALYNGNSFITNINLSSKWSWEYLWSNGNLNNSGITNKIPRMRFDEVRYKLPFKLNKDDSLKIVNVSGNILLDFIELEEIPLALNAPTNASIYVGNGSDLQNFINSNGGLNIFLSPGIYNVPNELYFDIPGTKLMGAGMWYTQINFTSSIIYQGGLRANANDVSFSNLYLTTNNSSRSNSYKAINGVFTSNSLIENIWAEHFECGAWIAQYASGGPTFANGFRMKNCRFRNNYADGVNLCKGTSNSIVEHCNFRNNGDDDQAIWSADGLECINNTFQYNTSEHCWRASGVAIYGGKNNKALHLIIKDNLEVGIRVNNSFPGVGFNSIGTHEFSDITIKSCGTFNDLYHNVVGAIDIFCANNSAGTQVRNCTFKTIDIIDSKNDAIYIAKQSGDGLYNLVFENININGTGLEFPFNNFKNLNWGRGFGVLIANQPNGNATYCNMTYSNRGGNSNVDVELSGKGSFQWTEALGCLTNVSNKKYSLEANIYPNPSNDYLIIELSEQEFVESKSTICILDVFGKVTIELPLSSNKMKINTSELSKGFYFVQLKVEDRSRIIKFLVN